MDNTSIKIDKALFEERMSHHYFVHKILLPKAKRECVIALPTGQIIETNDLAAVIEAIALTINSADEPIEQPEEYNVVQIPLFGKSGDGLEILKPAYLGLDEGMYVLHPEDITAIAATII